LKAELDTAGKYRHRDSIGRDNAAMPSFRIEKIWMDDAPDKVLSFPLDYVPILL